MLIRRPDGVHQDGLREQFVRSRDIFERRGQDLALEKELGQYTLYLYHKIQVKETQCFEPGNGHFIAATGTFIYKKRMGNAALELLYDDMQKGREYDTHLRGNFAVIAFIDGALSLMTDIGGIYRVYRCASGGFISSSFLAACRYSDSLTIAPQEYYEYLYNGASYGDRTFFGEIALCSCGFRHFLDGSGRKQKRTAQLTADLSGGFTGAVEQVAQQLSAYYATLHELFGNGVTAALSGGYDSRLVLALARRAGMDLRLYVYGGPNSPDVRVAKSIAEGEQLPLEHIDKGGFPEIPLAEFAESVRRSYYHFDGWNVVGVFDNGADIETRFQRTAQAQLQLNGGGGEIYRNFWDLPDRPYSPMQFVQSRYAPIDDPVFLRAYGEDRYREEMAQKIRSVLGVAEGRLSRRDIERLYPMWRLRYWMSVNNHINNMFAYTLTPYAEPVFTAASYDIPVAYKNNGAFQAAVINAVDPALAAYPSAYGHNFKDPLPAMSRLRSAMKRSIPVALRPALRKRFRQPEGSLPYWLSAPYIGTVLQLQSMECTNHVDVQRINSAEVLSRVYSFEMILQDCRTYK